MSIYAFETPRLWLEKLTVEDHLEDFHELWNHPNALLWSAQNVKETVEEAKAWMLGQLPSPDNPDINKFAILLRPVEGNMQPWVNAKGRPKMVGMVGTNRFSDQGLETGYCINLKYWGKGYAGEGFKGFLDLFWSLPERKEVKQLVAKVDPGNAASQKIVLRVGAKRGEVLKDWYSRSIDVGVKRDISCWYIDRPGVIEAELGVWAEEVKRQMVRKKKLEKEKERDEKEKNEEKKED